MRRLGLFTNKTFRKYRKLIFPHWDFIICIVSLAIVHPHFVILFSHPHFSIRILSSAFCYPPSAIRHPPFGPHFKETCTDSMDSIRCSGPELENSLHSRNQSDCRICWIPPLTSWKKDNLSVSSGRLKKIHRVEHFCLSVLRLISVMFLLLNASIQKYWYGCKFPSLDYFLLKCLFGISFFVLEIFTYYCIMQMRDMMTS